ncbi:MAG: copper chaperone PCu(A)C [Pseudomonadota bacterium]
MLKWIAGIAGVVVIGAGAFFLMHGHDDHDDDHGEHGDMDVVAFGDLEIIDAYVLPNTGSAPTAAAFFIIENDGSEDDRLIAASANVSALVELHTHIEEDGIMKMRAVEDGFSIPAGDEVKLKRGGDHVMFMGVEEQLADGDTFPLTLTFEKAGALTFEITVGEAGHEGHDH